MRRDLVASWRLLRGTAHILGGWWTVRVRFPKLSTAQREKAVQAWAQRLLQLWGIELQTVGQAHEEGPALLVSNHISWLDIVVMHASRHCRFVSKSDIKAWPVVGTLATHAGTLYIERHRRRDAHRMVQDVGQAMRNGDVIAVFPEGTTSDGQGVLPFHANLIEAALLAQVPVRPLALQFVDRHSGQASRAVCYIDDDTLVGSVWRTLRSPGIVARVYWGAEQQGQGRDRRQWAADLRHEVLRLREQSTL